MSVGSLPGGDASGRWTDVDGCGDAPFHVRVDANLLRFGPGMGLAGCGTDKKRSMGMFASARWALVSTQTDRNGAKRTKWVGALELPSHPHI